MLQVKLIYFVSVKYVYFVKLPFISHQAYN